MITSHQLVNLASVICLLFTAWPTGINGISSKGQYCNARFTFCVKYPSSLFPHEEKAENDSGVILKTYDQSGVVKVTGAMNTGSLSPKELFDAGLKNLPEPDAKVSVLTSVFGDDYYECSFLKGTTIYYQKGMYYEGHYVQLEIRTPVSKPALMPLLRGDVEVKITGQ